MATKRKLIDKPLAKVLVVSDSGEFEEIAVYERLIKAFEHGKDLRKNKVAHMIEAQDKRGYWICVDTWIPDEEESHEQGSIDGDHQRGASQVSDPT
jgi:hypothetical protein